jgi:hypothetical protein
MDAKTEKGVLGFHACIRDGVTVTQIADVVKLWLQKHPENRDYAAAGLVAAALEEAFPCPP